jgi:hypothetical protein
MMLLRSSLSPSQLHALSRLKKSWSSSIAFCCESLNVHFMWSGIICFCGFLWIQILAGWEFWAINLANLESLSWITICYLIVDLQLDLLFWVNLGIFLLSHSVSSSSNSPSELIGLWILVISSKFVYICFGSQLIKDVFLALEI